MDISASGLGFLSPALEGEYHLYRFFGDSKPFDTLGIRQNADGTLSFITKTLGDRLKPYRISEGDSHEEANHHIRMGLVRFCPELAFRVIERREDKFLVVLNEETGETAVMRAVYGTVPPQGFPVFGIGNSSLYEIWEQYLKRAEFINAENGRTTIADKPEGKIIFQDSKGRFLPYKVLEVEGDYIKVKKGPGREFNFEGLGDTEGWLRWRKGKRLLIKVTEFTLE